MIAIIAFDGACFGLIEKRELQEQREKLEFCDVMFVQVNSLEELKEKMTEQTQLHLGIDNGIDNENET